MKASEYYSNSLRCVQPYGYFLPDIPDGSADEYPLLILCHGHGGDWRDWNQYTRIARYLAGLDLIVVCPDCDNGWLTNAVGGGERREDDIVLDLLPHLESRFPIAGGSRRGIAGLSMGGYGAVKLALKHPALFRIAVSHSGALDIAGRHSPHPVFGDPHTDLPFRKAEDPFWLAEQALCRLPTERPAIFMDCGESDPLVGANRQFSEHVAYLGYGHVYREMRGHHSWPYWDRAFRTVLPDILKLLRVGSGKRAHDRAES